MSTKTAIANLSLLRVGVSQSLTDVDADGSRESLSILILWDNERRFVLRDFPWPFSRKYVTLTLVAGSVASPVNSDWVYSYRYPLDCVFARRLVDCSGRQSASPAPFVVGRDPDVAEAGAWNSGTAYVVGNHVLYLSVAYISIQNGSNKNPVTQTAYWTAIDRRLIFTNQTSAQLEYSVNVVDTGEFDDIFASMLAWRIAASLALSLSRMPELAKECLAMYAAERAEAMSRAVAEGEYAIASGQPSPRVRDIFNLALTRLGISRSTAGADPEFTFAALYPRVSFDLERDFVLRAFPWPCATKYATLDLIAGSTAAPVNDDWIFAYRTPTDCLFARRFVTGMARRDDNPPPYRTGRDYRKANTATTTMTLSTGAGWTIADTITVTASAAFFIATEEGNIIELTSGSSTVQITITGYTSSTVVTGTPDITVPAGLRSTALTTWSRVFEGALIYSDQEDAVLEYTKQETDPDAFDSMFISALAWKLAMTIAPSMAKLDVKGLLLQQTIRNYEMDIQRARVAAMNEQQQPAPLEAEWVTARGVGGALRPDGFIIR